MNKFRIEEWTERECELLNEMKDRCLNGRKYKDEKAKEKFKMICHLEDYCVQYYQLLDCINQLETNRDEAIEYIQKHFEEEYKKPREELKKYNLKNCTYDSGLVVLGILERGKGGSNE